MYIKSGGCRPRTPCPILGDSRSQTPRRWARASQSFGGSNTPDFMYMCKVPGSHFDRFYPAVRPQTGFRRPELTKCRFWTAESEGSRSVFLEKCFFGDLVFQGQQTTFVQESICFFFFEHGCFLGLGTPQASKKQLGQNPLRDPFELLDSRSRKSDHRPGASA